MMPANSFKSRLKAGEVQIGLWSSLADPTGSEILAGCGYAWMMLVLEHSTASPADALAWLRTLAAYPVNPVVRPGWNNPVEIKKLLDAGAQTRLIPYVQNAEEARQAVAAITYPPEGIRGVSGITRATRFGAVQGYAQRANEELCLLVQVETRTALDNLEEIATTPGVDGVFLGPADIAASFGHVGQPSHPEVKAAILDAMARLKVLGVPSGILSLDQAFLQEARGAGAAFVAVDVDSGMLRRAACARRAEWA